MMPDSNKSIDTGLVRAILGDLHFWIPVVVLAGGLAVLHWIS